MKHNCIAILILCTFVAVAASAQDDGVGGRGTPNFIAKFSGTHRLSNSTIFQSPNGNIGIGTTTPIVPLHIFSSNPVGPVGYNPITMWVESAADNAQGAVYGVSSSPVGGIGINGEAYGSQGNGVLGNYTSSTGGGGGGVIGLTNSADFGFSYATRGTATASTGSAVAFFGETFSPDGTAGYFLNRAAGNIIVGHVGQNDDKSVFRVDGTGRVFADGGFQPSGADFAESMAATGDRSKYAAGDLLVIDPTANRHVALAQQPYSTLVAGIYSTKPGMLGTTRKIDESAPGNEIPLAVVGIVPCKVTAENGPVQVGDLLVTSSIPGHAMKGTDRSRMLGAVVGKALEPLPNGTGVIQVLVTLQ